MSKVLFIPDVHLKPVIFDRAERILESGQADRAVQLGDLVDDWGEEANLGLYDRTIDRAIKFHQKFPETLWCMGNHDFGYYHPLFGRRETGHSVLEEPFMETKISKMIQAGIQQKILHIVDNVIFSHAGLTNEWIAQLTLDETDCPADGHIESLANRVEPDLLWNNASPIWARPQISDLSLFSDKMQVVGHTPVESAMLVGTLLSTDVFSTHRNGAPLGDRRFVIVDTEKQSWAYAEEPNQS